MSEWRTFTVTALAEPRGLVGGPFGSSLGSKDYVSSGVPVIRGVNLGSAGRFNASEFVYVTHEKANGELSRNQALPGDVVFTQRGTLGQVGIVPHGIHDRYVISQSQMRLRVNQSLASSEYVYYWFRSSEVIASIHNHAITTGVPHINLGILGKLEVCVPSLATQNAITTILGALDDKIAVNERVSSTALHLAALRYLQGVVSDPASRSLSLADAATWTSGGTPRTSEPSYWGGEIPWISALSLKSPWIADSDRRLTKLGVANGTRLAQPGTVLFVVRGSSLKDEFRIGLAVREVAFGQDCKGLTPKFSTGHVLFHAIRAHTPTILDMVDETSIGAGRLATDLMTKLEIRLPGPSSSLPDELEMLDKVAINAESETRRLAELRDALLPKLMSGEIRVRDAERLVGDAV